MLFAEFMSALMFITEPMFHYGTDVDLVTEAALEAADRVPHTLKERKSGVWLVDFGDSSFKLRTRGLDYLRCGEETRSSGCCL